MNQLQKLRAKYAGKAPARSAAELSSPAVLSNNGRRAENIVQKLTKGWDKVAYPVK